MKSWPIAAALCLASSPIFAASYRLVLQPVNGKLLIGHAGVQAVDERTSTALVRIVSPGNRIDERGTVRVLVMNLGAKPFQFGPDQVRLELSDGTVLQPTSVDAMEKGRQLVEWESGRAWTNDLRIRNNLSGTEQQTNSGVRPLTPVPGATAPSSEATRYNERTDENLQPGAQTLNAIYQILIEQPVEPSKAWGGYYVFDVPSRIFARKTDQPLTILVTTGGEVHRFNATLKWK
jgi:hypothetical protein